MAAAHSYHMNHTLRALRCTSLLALAGALGTGFLGSGCAATAKHDSTGEYIDDSSITTKVKAALLNDASVKSLEISVQTMKGVVQLSGFVDTTDQKQAAARAAAAVPGVVDVTNSLIVK